MSTAYPQSEYLDESPEHSAPIDPVVRIYSHSPIFYWWPVWVAGFVLGGLSWWNGVDAQIGRNPERYLTGQAPGLTWAVIFLLVVLFTNVTMRGLVSVIALLSVALVVLFVTWMGWWDPIIEIVPQMSVRMNLGFYLFTSTILFVFWAATVFGYDRLMYWSVRPGQVVRHAVIGEAARSYDTRGMVFEKRREDFFRHWLLGLGSGDVRILTSGARTEEIVVPNVLFVDSKLREVQRLIAIRPDLAARPAPPHEV